MHALPWISKIAHSVLRDHDAFAALKLLGYLVKGGGFYLVATWSMPGRERMLSAACRARMLSGACSGLPS
jgi:hypothetical protein